jgi:hypothetical protein
MNIRFSPTLLTFFALAVLNPLVSSAQTNAVAVNTNCANLAMVETRRETTSINDGSIGFDALEAELRREDLNYLSIENVCVTGIGQVLELPFEVRIDNVSFDQPTNLEFNQEKHGTIRVSRVRNLADLIVTAAWTDNLWLGDNEAYLEADRIIIESLHGSAVKRKVSTCVQSDDRHSVSVSSNAEHIHARLCDFGITIFDGAGEMDIRLDNALRSRIEFAEGLGHNFELRAESVELWVRNRIECSRDEIIDAANQMSGWDFLEFISTGEDVADHPGDLIVETKELEVRGFRGRLVIRRNVPLSSRASSIATERLVVICSTLAEISGFGAVLKQLRLNRVGINERLIVDPTTQAALIANGKVRLQNLVYAGDGPVELPVFLVGQIPRSYSLAPNAMPDLNRLVVPSAVTDNPATVNALRKELVNTLSEIVFDPPLGPADSRKWLCGLSRIKRRGLPETFWSNCNPFGHLLWTQ